MYSSRWIMPLVIVAMLLNLVACTGDDGIDGTGLSGTAAVGAPITNATISVKFSNGTKLNTSTDSEGKFGFITTDKPLPALIRVLKNDGSYLYSVATSYGTANVHPLTDLIIRNWYKVKNSDVEIEFESVDALSNAPSVDEINVLKEVIKEIFKVLFSEFNVPDDFDIIESIFDANGINAFDKVLDHISIKYEDGKIKIKIRDDETDIETEITDDLNYDDDIKLLDTLSPILVNPPTSNVFAVAASATKIIVVWDAATDNIAVAGYNIIRDDGQTFTSPYPVFIDENSLSPTTEYCYQIQAFDGALDADGNPAHNLSAITSIDTNACATSLDAPDTDNPVAVVNVIATTLDSDHITVSWDKAASIDVIGYHLYRGDSGAISSKITTIIGNAYNDSGLSAESQYCYAVVAFDAAGNLSATSLDNGVDNCATTLSDTTPPVAPTVNPISSITDQVQITVSGGSEADSTVTVTGGSMVTSTMATSTGSFSVSVRLALDASNSLSVQAEDGAGNKSTAVSNDTSNNPLTVTQDSTPPEVLSVNPINNAMNIAIDANIVITFLEEIRPDTINAANIVLKAGANIISTTYSSNGSMITVIPNAPLSYLTAYTLELNSVAIVDLAGNSLINYSSVTFTTLDAVGAPPTADAGNDVTVNFGDTVSLNGNNSIDPRGNGLNYMWTLLVQPDMSTVSLPTVSNATPTFVPDVAGSYTAQLIVNDGVVDSAAASVIITVTPNAVNQIPIANAGVDQEIANGATVFLDGSGSKDVDGDTLTYQWSFVSRPTGSNAVLVGETTKLPTFVADVFGNFVVQLIVDDGVAGASAAHTVSFNAVFMCGSLITSTIADAGDQDFYTFTATAGDVVSLTLVQTQGFGGGANAVAASLKDPLGVEVTNFSANSQKKITLLLDGEYKIRIFSPNLTLTGTYHLGLECLSPLGQIESNLVHGDLVTATISAPGEQDLYTFSGNEDDLVSMTLVQTAGFGGGSSAVAAVIYDSSGSVVTTLLANTQPEFLLPATDTYIISVRANNLVLTGTYHLGLEFITPLGAPIAGTLVHGDLVTATISTPGEQDLYTFSGNKDDLVSMTLVQTAGFGGGSSAVAAVIYDSAGRVVTTLLANTQPEFLLPATDTYIISVRANNLVLTGTYHLGLEFIAPLGTSIAGTLVKGNLIVGATIDSPGEQDLYTFSGASDEVVSVTLVQTAGFGGGSRAVAAVIYDSAGAVVSTFTANQIVDVTLPSTGTFIISVRANTLTLTGTYNLGLN